MNAVRVVRGPVASALTDALALAYRQGAEAMRRAWIASLCVACDRGEEPEERGGHLVHVDREEADELTVACDAETVRRMDVGGGA